MVAKTAYGTRERFVHGSSPAPTNRASLTSMQQLLATGAFSLFMWWLNWPEIFEIVNGTPMKDRANYLNRIEMYANGLSPAVWRGVGAFLSEEYVWQRILSGIAKLFAGDPGVALGLISMFATFTFALLVVSRTGSPVLLLLLINPLFVGFVYSQVRLALAMALITMALFLLSGRRVLSLFLLALALGIHTSAAVFAIVAVVVSTGWARSKSKPGWSYLSVAMTSFVAALMLGPLREVLLVSLDDRRQDAQYVTHSLTFMSLWIVLTILLSINWEIIESESASRYGLAILLLSTFSLLLGGYPHRTLALGQPFIVIALHLFASRFKPIVFVAFVVYMLWYWSNWAPFWRLL